MKNIYEYLLILVVGVGMTSCLDYLDIVPDEVPTSADAFMDEDAANRFMYSCYAFLPDPSQGASSLDLMTGDEVITAFEHEQFAGFPKGNYTAATPVISYWDTFFQGLRQCHIMLNNVDKVPGLAANKINSYKGEANFLIAYYHYLLIRCYGSTILVREEPDPSISIGDYLGRSPLDECVDYVCQKFDEASSQLPDTRVGKDYGRATSIVAKALKAKMLVYAASPLFNSDRYKDVVDAEGVHLFPTAADPNKWNRAKDALKVAIDAAEAAGHSLFKNVSYGSNKYPQDPMQRVLRYELHDAGNSDIIWADCRQGHIYGLQNKCLPNGITGKDPMWNGVSPTWAMLTRFYTEKGLPIDEDPAYDYSNCMKIASINNDQFGKVGEKTMVFNLNREPRFYAWVAFQGSFYEITNNNSAGGFDGESTYDDGRLVCGFVIGENCSRGPELKSLRTNNYAPTCYLNKKGVDPDYQVTTSSLSVPEYPWPLMRLADLYLLYAEACVECNDLTMAKTELNKVRIHAGIPEVETSWQGVAELTQGKLREIVRRERMNEMYLENQNFWDMRRWLMGEECFNHKVQGLKNNAETLEDMFQIVSYDFERKFDVHQYLLPIPDTDVKRNPKIIQNPGY